MNHLAAKYGEQPVARGLVSTGAVIEILVAPDGETWSIVVTLPNGLSCGLAAGETWQTVPVAPVPKPKDAAA